MDAVALTQPENFQPTHVRFIHRLASQNRWQYWVNTCEMEKWAVPKLNAKADAEKLSGISQVQVSRWRQRLQNKASYLSLWLTQTFARARAQESASCLVLNCRGPLL